MYSGSKRFQFDETDLTKTGKGLLIAMAGAGVTYLATWVADTDFGELTPIIVAAAGVAINAARKWITDNSQA